MVKKGQNRRKPGKKRSSPVREPVPRVIQGEPGENGTFYVVGIGASAGGLEAFTQLLKSLPSDTGMGFVLIQHLDPDHESALTQILSRVTSLPVREISDGDPVKPNHVHVIPRDKNLAIAKGVLKLTPRPKTRAPHRPIDSFFESLAQDQVECAIGVVLSGTATDGTLGLEAIKAEGGITFAQDDSAKHDSMPRSAVAAGCVDLVLPPHGIAQELARIAKHPFVAAGALARPPRGEVDRAEATAHQDDLTPLPPGRQGESRSGGKQARSESRQPATADDEGYKKILQLLHSHSGVDFTLYKSTTIQRRVGRRMILTKHDALFDYASFLRANVKELDALYSDVLISVTSFFRNPEMFDVLQHKVLPALLEQRSDGPLRCWVLGCSTGQEAYSIAMSFVETAEKAPRTRSLQIFATDLNEALLDKARQGLYARNLAEEIAPERLRRFFVEEEGGYRITKSLREMVVFARQNLISDPPFSRMDLVSCRNLLIYLEPSLQKKALPTFHYSLKPHGFLLLGASESIGGFTDLFEPVDKKHKIYSRKPAPTPTLHLPVGRDRGEQSANDRRPRPVVGQAAALDLPEGFHGDLAAQREADRISLSQYAPPGVLVNADLQVLQFRGPTGAYLELPPGKASFDLLKMAREGLMLPLRAAVNEARKENRAARRTDVRVSQNGTTRSVNLEVIPLKKLNVRCFLIVFEDAAKATGGGGRAQDVVRPSEPPLSKKRERNRIAELETDLAEMREYHQSVQEQHEAANEELQAANEEVQSTNEELQSVNEELETSKEELESANEELTTVNEEMNNRNLELTRLNNDLVNLQVSIHLAVVLLSRALNIRRFSPQARKQFQLLATDVGRPIAHLRHNLVLPESDLQAPERAVDLDHIAAEVIASVREQAHEVQDRAGRWYSLRVHPYLTLDNVVDGAVLVFMDIDAIKRVEQDIAAARDYAESIVETVRQPLLVLDADLRVEYANRSFYREFIVAQADTVGKAIFDLGNREWDIPLLRDLLRETQAQGTSIEDFRVEHEFASIGPKVMLLNARSVIDPQKKSERILLAIEDITERTRAQDTLRENYARLQASADELSRFNDVAVGRELRMIDLKKEVNALCQQHGEAARYPLDFEREVEDGIDP